MDRIISCWSRGTRITRHAFAMAVRFAPTVGGIGNDRHHVVHDRCRGTARVTVRQLNHWATVGYVHPDQIPRNAGRGGHARRWTPGEIDVAEMVGVFSRTLLRDDLLAMLAGAVRQGTGVTLLDGDYEVRVTLRQRPYEPVVGLLAMNDDHVPTPFGDSEGGGIRCSCGWLGLTTPKTRSNRGRGMSTVWTSFREHWKACHPLADVMFYDLPDVVELPLFDPSPWDA